jgi:hypothetical protein
MVHVYNSSYLGDGDQKDGGSRLGWGARGVCARASETPFQPISGCSGVHLSSQTSKEADIMKVSVLGQPRQKSFQDHISVGKN